MSFQGGSAKLPPFSFAPHAILAGVAGLRQNLCAG
jgi:hypothetical protein